MYPSTFIADPVVGLLQSVETKKVVQNVVFVLQVVQPLTAPITFFTRLIVHKNHGRGCPVVGACLLASRVVQKGLQRVDISTQGPLVEPLRVQPKLPRLG